MKAGLDISINGSAVAFEDGTFYYQTIVKNRVIQTSSITCDLLPKSRFKLDSLKYYEGASLIRTALRKKEVDFAAMEGYAYGYKTTFGLVFSLAEHCGMVKCMMIEDGVKIEVFSPSEIKKRSVGKGNSTKVPMVDEYLRTAKLGDPIVELIETLGEENRYMSPVSDLVDAAWILKLID